MPIEINFENNVLDRLKQKNLDSSIFIEKTHNYLVNSDINENDIIKFFSICQFIDLDRGYREEYNLIIKNGVASFRRGYSLEEDLLSKCLENGDILNHQNPYYIHSDIVGQSGYYPYDWYLSMRNYSKIGDITKYDIYPKKNRIDLVQTKRKFITSYNSITEYKGTFHFCNMKFFPLIKNNFKEIIKDSGKPLNPLYCFILESKVSLVNFYSISYNQKPFLQFKIKTNVESLTSRKLVDIIDEY